MIWTVSQVSDWPIGKKNKKIKNIKNIKNQTNKKQKNKILGFFSIKCGHNMYNLDGKNCSFFINYHNFNNKLDSYLFDFKINTFQWRLYTCIIWGNEYSVHIHNFESESFYGGPRERTFLQTPENGLLCVKAVDPLS